MGRLETEVWCTTWSRSPQCPGVATQGDAAFSIISSTSWEQSANWTPDQERKRTAKKSSVGSPRSRDATPEPSRPLLRADPSARCLRQHGGLHEELRVLVHQQPIHHPATGSDSFSSSHERVGVWWGMVELGTLVTSNPSQKPTWCSIPHRYAVYGMWDRASYARQFMI